MPSEVRMGVAPAVTGEATEIRRMVAVLERIGQSAYSVSVQMDQFKKWLKREIVRNPAVVVAMAGNENIRKFVNSATKEE